MMTDLNTGTTHGFFDTGCFKQDAAHVAGYQVVHAVSNHGPDGPFVFKEAMIPQWSDGWCGTPTPFWRHLLDQHEHFTKTGSGQT
jgi:hypothetical protein